MKIERFSHINENLTSDVKEFIENFDGSTDAGIIDWIDSVASDTKLNDYKNFTEKKALNFAKSRNLKNLSQYILIDKEIENKEKEIEKLNLKKDKLKILATDELLYRFQEDLVNMDFDKLYKFFIEDSVENQRIDHNNDDIEEILKYSEIHPKILKKYKNKIIIGMSVKKYNI